MAEVCIVLIKSKNINSWNGRQPKIVDVVTSGTKSRANMYRRVIANLFLTQVSCSVS